jgi:copper(I)-binding protein
VNPLERRTFVTASLAVSGLALSLVLSGCGAGQISQTATQEPAVNGTSGNAGPIALRNVHLRAPQTTDYIKPGTEAELLFTASNTSPDVNDKLVSITSDVGSVKLSGKGDVPANGVLVVGTPDGQTAALGSVEAADSSQAKVTLSKPITNGLTYDFTFKFEKSGEATLSVPISAGEAPRREAAPAGSGAPAGGH